MSGNFNLKFWHGIPPVDTWQALFKTQNIVRKLPQNEFDEANRVMNDDEMKERFNVTIRWHESHYNGCSYLCSTDVADADTPCLPASAPVKRCLKRQQ